MNIKIEIATLAVRVLSEKTNLLPKPDAFSEFISVMFNGETHEQRVARELVADAEKLVDAAKRARTNRKFKKITANI